MQVLKKSNIIDYMSKYDAYKLPVWNTFKTMV
jgi:hypothetical protein